MDRPVTLVTGARKGLGRALAEHYVALGHEVVGCSRKPAEWDHPRYRHVLADVVNVTDFFLRPESAFVTGQCIYLGGV